MYIVSQSTTCFFMSIHLIYTGIMEFLVVILYLFPNSHFTLQELKLLEGATFANIRQVWFLRLLVLCFGSKNFIFNWIRLVSFLPMRYGNLNYKGKDNPFTKCDPPHLCLSLSQRILRLNFNQDDRIGAPWSFPWVHLSTGRDGREVVYRLDQLIRWINVYTVNTFIHHNRFRTIFIHHSRQLFTVTAI